MHAINMGCKDRDVDAQGGAEVEFVSLITILACVARTLPFERMWN